MKIIPGITKPGLAHSSEANQRIYEFLKTHPIGVLATVGPNGDPQATVLYFSVDEDFNITFTTKHDTKKYENLVHFNHAMLVAYEASSQVSAQISGKVEEINDTSEAEEVFKHTLESARSTSDSEVPPISKLYAGRYVALKLKPTKIRMAVFIRPDPGGYDIYETIDFQT